MIKTLPYLIALSALTISASAAFYSVYGLSMLFAGASTQVIIMAGSLEASKLIIATLLYQYWDSLNKFLRMYFVAATLILMIITSGGIYGYLSGAYQATSTQSEFLDKQEAAVKQKQIRFKEQEVDLKKEKTALITSISDLRIAISNPGQTQYFDKSSGQVITSTSNASRKALQKELNVSITERDKINVQLNMIADSITALDMLILNTQINNESSRELGPLKYMSELTKQPMAIIVNWFMLLIIFVFDPLAIALVIAANMAFAQIKKEEPEDVVEDYFKKRNMQISKAVDEVTYAHTVGINELEDKASILSNIFDKIRNKIKLKNKKR